MIRFVDAHVHPPVRQFFEGPIAPFLPAMEEFTGIGLTPMTAEELADFYRKRAARAVLLGWNSRLGSGYRSFGNREIKAIVDVAPDVFYGFGAVDPSGGASSVAGAHEAARIGLSGLSFHPAAERTAPLPRENRHLWETALEHGLIVLVHTGFSRLGAGQPGGGGVGLEHARPINVDRLAAAFPGLKIILAHTGSLWLDEAMAIAIHKGNVHLCLSGVSPKAINPDLLELIRGPLSERVHFGSDYPFGNPDEWLTEWESLGLPESLNRAVLVDNIIRLLEGD